MTNTKNHKPKFISNLYQISIGSFTRTWLKFCNQHRKLALVIVVLTISTIVCGLFQNTLPAKSITYIAIGILIGIFLSALNLNIDFKVLAQTLGPEPSSNDSKLELLNQYSEEFFTKVKDLQNTVVEMHEETDILIDRYEKLTENLAAAIIIRSPESKILYCSPYTEILTGYSIDDFYDETKDFFLSIVHEEDHKLYFKALNANHIGESYQVRYRYYHQSGMEMWADTRTVPIYADDGSLISSLSITLDVTGAVRQQKQVEEKNRDLEDFSYMISHDLKAPIYTVKGMTQILKEDFTDIENPDFLETVTHIEKATLRLEQLVASVLEYSRISTTKSEEGPVALKDVFEDIHNDFQAHLNSTNSTLRIQADLPVVLGDRLKIYQIFANLVGNAIKYRSSERDLVININHNHSKNMRHAIICVADNGSGIPTEKQSAVFRPFQRAHGKDIEGSGIGLACVKKLLDKLGGHVWLESTEEQGTSFYVQMRHANSYL